MSYTAILSFTFKGSSNNEVKRIGLALEHVGWQHLPSSAYIYNQGKTENDGDALKRIWTGIELVARGSAEVAMALESVSYTVQIIEPEPLKSPTTPPNAYKRLMGLPLPSATPAPPRGGDAGGEAGADGDGDAET